MTPVLLIIIFSFSDTSDWLRLFGLNFNAMFGQKYHASQPSALAVQGDKIQAISVGLHNHYQTSSALLGQPNLLDESFLTASGIQLPALKGKVLLEGSPFGKGLLISTKRDKVFVSSVPGTEYEVVHNVFSSVLNASTILDISFSGRGEYFFHKQDERSFGDDYQQLQRLSGTHNITKDNFNPRGRMLCAETRSRHPSKICLIYGVEKRDASKHVMRPVHKRAISKAWEREAKKVQMGLLGGWTQSQRSELLKRGQLRGFQPVEVRNVHKFPELIGQSSNILFVRESESKNWHQKRRNQGRNV